MWKTNTDMDIMYNKILNPFDNIYIQMKHLLKTTNVGKGVEIVRDLIKKLKKKKKNNSKGKKKKQKR